MEAGSRRRSVPTMPFVITDLADVAHTDGLAAHGTGYLRIS